MSTVVIDKKTTNRLSLSRKRSSDLTNNTIDNQQEQINDSSLKSRLRRSSKTRAIPLSIPEAVTKRSRKSASGSKPDVKSDTVVYLSSSESPSPTSISRNSAGISKNKLNDQLKADEEYARKLQLEFNKNYNESIRIELHDRAIAQKLQSMENNIYDDQNRSIQENTINSIKQPQQNITNIPVRCIIPMSSTTATTTTATTTTATTTTATTTTATSTATNETRDKQITSIRPLISRFQELSRTLISTDSIQNHDKIIQSRPMLTKYSNSCNSHDKFSLLNTYEYQMKSNDSSIDIECTICLEDYSRKSFVTHLACMHKFHTKCIKEWLNKKEDCPICNKNALTAQ